MCTLWLSSLVTVEFFAAGSDAMCHQEELRTLKYSILKDKLLSVESSRAAQLQWLTEFMVFVGSHHSTLSEYPNLTFQYAMNQVRLTVIGPCDRSMLLCRLFRLPSF
jgi:hypothetical protein